MTIEQLLQQTWKILEEETPFSYSRIPNSTSLSVRLPKDRNTSFKFPNIRIDFGEPYSSGEEAIASVRMSADNDVYFARNFSDPQVLSTTIAKELDKNFSRILSRLSDLDFSLSDDLQDFLKSQGYHITPAWKKGTPHFYVDSPIPQVSYLIELSSYRNEGFITITEVQDKDEGGVDERQIYRSSLTQKTQKQVFTEILSTLRRYMDT